MAGRPRSADVDRALREAAVSLFVESGFSALSFEEVARRAGVSRAALYRRWSSREALLADALRSYRFAFDGFTPDVETPTLNDLLDTLAERASAAFADPFMRAMICRVLTLGAKGDTIRRQYFDVVVAPRRAALTRAIVAARDAGQIDASIDPELVQDVIAGALVYKLLSGEVTHSGFDGERYVLDIFRMTGLKR